MMHRVAGFPGGGLLRLFQRILCVTGGIISVWFVAALLTAGGGTAQAAELPALPAPDTPFATIDVRSSGTAVLAPTVDDPSTMSVAATGHAPLGVAVDTVSVEGAHQASGSLQASPGAVSASANRRAIIDQAVVDAGLASLPVAEAPPVAPAPNLEPAAPEHPAPLSLTPPALPLGTPDHRADSGPSGAHLAVITAALLAVVWLTQQLHADAHRWRSVRVSTRIERPG